MGKDDSRPHQCAIERLSQPGLEVCGEVYRTINVAAVSVRRRVVVSEDWRATPTLIENMHRHIAAKPFDHWVDVAIWLARLLEEEFASLQADPVETNECRLEFVWEMSRLLFPNSRKVSIKDEIARLYVWPYPFIARGEA